MPEFFIILAEAVVVLIALYAIKGIAMYERIAMLLLVIMMGLVVFKAFSSFEFEKILATPEDATMGMTIMVVFDIIVATALSYVPMAADYNRNCKTAKGAILGCSIGYILGTTLVMGVGALMIGMVISSGQTLEYEPSIIYSQIGLGLPGAISIFISIIAANVMCLFSSTMSIVNMLPKVKFKYTVLLLGLVCAIGALFSGILDVF